MMATTWPPEQRLASGYQALSWLISSSCFDKKSEGPCRQRLASPTLQTFNHLHCWGGEGVKRKQANKQTNQSTAWIYCREGKGRGRAMKFQSNQPIWDWSITGISQSRIEFISFPQPHPPWIPIYKRQPLILQSSISWPSPTNTRRTSTRLGSRGDAHRKVRMRQGGKKKCPIISVSLEQKDCSFYLLHLYRPVHVSKCPITLWFRLTSVWVDVFNEFASLPSKAVRCLTPPHTPPRTWRILEV